MAAGPGIRPSAPGAPFGSGRSARNYAHLVAERLGLDLIDATFSGVTTGDPVGGAARAARNSPIRVAERLGLDLIDATFSGAPPAHLLAERQRSAPPQTEALDGS